MKKIIQFKNKIVPDKEKFIREQSQVIINYILIGEKILGHKIQTQFEKEDYFDLFIDINRDVELGFQSWLIELLGLLKHYRNINQYFRMAYKYSQITLEQLENGKLLDRFDNYKRLGLNELFYSMANELNDESIRGYFIKTIMKTNATIEVKYGILRIYMFKFIGKSQYANEIIKRLDLLLKVNI